MGWSEESENTWLSWDPITETKPWNIFGETLDRVNGLLMKWFIEVHYLSGIKIIGLSWTNI